MRIFLTNDDGIQSIGLYELANVLTKKHEVVVVAPSTEQSGMSHAITVHKEIEVCKVDMKEVGVYEAWKIDGTPADCVKLYFEAMHDVKNPFDLVISGINKGANLGTDVLYSGTVGAATEGFLQGISSIAVSMELASTLRYEEVAKVLVEQLPIFMNEVKFPLLLNVNFPRKFLNDIPTFVYASIGERFYANAFNRVERDDKLFFVMAGEVCDFENTETSDISLVKKGYISVSPLKIDITDYNIINNKLNK